LKPKRAEMSSPAKSKRVARFCGPPGAVPPAGKNFISIRRPSAKMAGDRMPLTDAQRQQVAAWIAAGMKLSEVQNRLAAEFGLALTYMEVRLLVDDLRVIPPDPEPAPPPLPAPEAAPPPAPANPDSDPLPAGGVSVSVDKLTRSGALASGKVTFSDGQQGDWYLDPMGRLGVVPAQQDYQPSPEDVQEFQLALQAELGRLGY